MADRTLQILPGGQSAAPFVYPIPASTSFTLKGVTATFDGAAAAGNFLPCVELVSDAAVVMAFALGASVTAGGSATVSFDPFEQGQTSGGGTDPLAVHFDTSPQTGTFLEATTTQAGTGILLNNTGGGSVNIAATGSFANSVVDITADAQVFVGSPAITERIGTGGDYVIQNHLGTTIVDIRESALIEWHLGLNQRFTVYDSGGNPILEVREGAGTPTYHLKTGGAWVADL